MINIEDILLICIDKASAQKEKMNFVLYNDTDGASGVFYRLIELTKDRKLDLDYIGNIVVKASCTWDQ